MKLHLLNRDSLLNSSFRVEKHSYTSFLKVWHYHPELELVLSQKGSGTRFVGDSIEQFKEGDIVLIGKNLPHMWLSDKNNPKVAPKLVSESIVFHFKEDFLGPTFFENPEMIPIAKLIERSKHGIKFLNTNKKITQLIIKTLNKKGFNKTMKFLNVLNLLAKHSDYELLASKGYINSDTIQDYNSLTKVYEYIFKNFKTKIDLDSIAQIAHMNPSSFSRCFKRLNNKTFSKYLNEIRIGYACKLLMEEKYNITYICFESGYNNLSNFNRQFKLITGNTPSGYIALRKGNSNNIN